MQYIRGGKEKKIAQDYLEAIVEKLIRLSSVSRFIQGVSRDQKQLKYGGSSTQTI